jgi:hypothetical protein
MGHGRWKDVPIAVPSCDSAMTRNSPAWLAPTTLEEALAPHADSGEEATVLARGTFIGILASLARTRIIQR